MCGIAGIVSLEGVNPIDLHKMSTILQHRGPDDEGFLLLNSDSRNFKGKGTIKELADMPFIQDANFAKLSSAHFYSWKKGLKTGMYYLRTKAAADAIKFTVDQGALLEKVAVLGNEDQLLVERGQAHILSEEELQAQISCSLDNPDACEACGS